MGHPWPSAAKPASMPVYPLRRTSTRPLDGARKSKAKAEQKPKRGGLTADLIGSRMRFPCRSQACRRTRRCGVSVVPRYRSSPASLAPTGDGGYLQRSGRLSGRLAFVFDLGAPLTTMAERRHCAVGKPAGRRFSRAGPGMAHRGDPRSNAGERACRALARHRVVGQSLLLPFWRLKKGVAVRAKP
ncbi:hypothetical protein SAMN04490206_3457 [Pseudomonas umsongensis]|nr:hypothetical protein SAMN04490206_3457 [Pseudomonas umsongensis]